MGFQGSSIPFQRCQTTLVPAGSESRFLSGPDHGRLFSIPGSCCNLNDCFNKNFKLSKVSWASLVCLPPQHGWQGSLLWALRKPGLHPPCLPQGPQLRSRVTCNRRITFSRSTRAPLTALSPGNALPSLPRPVGHSVSRRGPCPGACKSPPPNPSSSAQNGDTWKQKHLKGLLSPAP